MPFHPLSTVPFLPLTWLWPGWLPVGNLVILDGNPGMGKSFITLDLIARLTAGKAFPQNAPARASANAVLLNAEDTVAEVLIPRLKVAGADLERIHFWEPEEDGDLLRFPSQLHRLNELLLRTRAGLVVIDPFMAFLDPGIQIGSDPSVRRVLHLLYQLAQKRGCIILLVRHFNKATRLHAIYRGGGSIGITAACRCAWLVAQDPLDPGRHVLAQVKNNYAPIERSIAYCLEKEVEGQLRLRWLDAVPWSAEQLLGSRQPLLSKLELATEFVRSFLEAGPQPSDRIWQAAQKHNISERTMHRARAKINAAIDRRWVGKKFLTTWRLDTQKSPNGTEEVYPDLEEFLRPIRENFTPPNPLDHE
jgi:RecA-family ATPase